MLNFFWNTDRLAAFALSGVATLDWNMYLRYFLGCDDGTSLRAERQMQLRRHHPAEAFFMRHPDGNSVQFVRFP